MPFSHKRHVPYQTYPHSPPAMTSIGNFSNLQALDWVIVGCVLATILGFALYSRRYNRSVADFLSANRCAGRYLLTLAAGISAMGAISIVAMWEQYYQAGFSALYWSKIMAPIALLMSLSGYIVYRFRETRALTFAQFLEIRYSRKFRLFAGFLAFLSGILNYGIFPAVTGRFMIYFFDLPQLFWTVPGIGLELNVTLGAVMALLLGFALYITLNGGQISIIITDFIQGQLSNIVFLILLGVMLWLFPWDVIVETLKQAPENASLLDPFDSTKLPDFNPVFFIILMLLNVYNYRVWQGSQGYNTSAVSPHEARMAGVLSEFRGAIIMLLIPLTAICAYVLMHGPINEEATLAAQATIDSIEDAQIAKQMTTPVALSEMLPVGVMGLLAAVMIMAAVSTDNTYMHSWGSIFIQDVLLPFRQFRGRSRHLTPEAHLRLLRRSILGVALFAWTFSMIFPLKEYIFMYFQVTGAIFLGGGGAILIGGLYWKKGTAAGAWAAMIVGATFAVTGVLTINIIWPNLIPYLQATYPKSEWIGNLPEVFWLNGVEMAFLAAIAASLSYVAASLISKDPGANMDKLLHSGAYQAKTPEGTDHLAPPKTGLAAILPSAEFTGGDRVIYYAKLIWSLFFILSFVIIALWQIFYRWPDDWWANWWFFNVVFIGISGTIATVWFLIGGFIDMKKMFLRLERIDRDNKDDGTVEDENPV